VGKREFYWECIKVAFKNWLGITSAVFFVFFGALAFFRPQWGETVNIITWAIPLAVFIATLSWAPFSVFDKCAKSKEKLQKELDDIKDRQPYMCFVKAENVQAPLRDLVTGELRGLPWFTHAIFANAPTLSTKGATAEKVVGHVELYDDSRQLLFSMIGRWAETPERAEVGSRVVETNQIDMAPNAMPRALDVVLKYEGEEECYGLNNETPTRAPLDWKDKYRKLISGTYIIKIRLRGTNVDNEFWFVLTNPGVDGKVELTEVYDF
jgi:hypothetical protein